MFTAVNPTAVNPAFDCNEEIYFWVCSQSHCQKQSRMKVVIILETSLGSDYYRKQFSKDGN